MILNICKISVLFLTALHAHGDTLGKTVSFIVPMCPQVKSQWCWAAASESVLKFYGFDVSQYDCASVITKKSLPQSMSAIEKIFEVSKGPYALQMRQMLTLQQIQELTVRKEPSIIFWKWSHGGGHYVVCSGSKDSLIRIMNPWPMYKGSWEYGTYKWVKYAQNRGRWVGTIITSSNTKNAEKISFPRIIFASDFK